MNDTALTQTRIHPGYVEVPRVKVGVAQPHGKVVEFDLSLRPLLVGSRADCDVVLKDPSASRQHCRITLDETGIVVRDLGSKNGTQVGSLTIREAVVAPGDVINVGQCRIQFRVLGDPQKVPLSSNARFGEALGSSAAMRALFAKLERVAPTDETVLLVGESGTGKELLARAVHDQSRRAEGPFAIFDCASVTGNLVEAELFGHARGAFTGAVAARAGVFEQGQRGTLFIDEIGELPMELQPRLLRALEQRQVRRLGEAEWRDVDVRVVAATHRDLRALAKSGEFRDDLLYRLEVVNLQVPPLRERKDDLSLLVERFLASHRPPLTVDELPPGALSLLRAHDWPGNVRELRNAVSRLVLFPEEASGAVAGAPSRSGEPDLAALLGLPLRAARDLVVERFERQYIRAKLDAHEGNLTRAAESMGVSRQFLHRLVQRYELRRDDTGA